MNENEIASLVVDLSVKIHRDIGPGLIERVYEAVLAHELRGRGLDVQRQVPIQFRYKNMTFDEAFRADVIIEGKVILEIKSVPQILVASKKQLLTYLRLADMRLGLILNFGGYLMKDGIERVVNGLPEGEIDLHK